MKIVSFTKDDQQKTAAFMRTIYHEMGWKESSSDGLDNLEHFFHIPTKEGFLLVVKDNNKIVGTGGCVLLETKESLLKRFYINKDYRGKGLAQEFFQRIIQYAKETLFVDRIVIDVSKNNARATRFYEKCGFREYHPKPVSMWPESSHPEKFNYYFLTLEEN